MPRRDLLLILAALIALKKCETAEAQTSPIPASPDTQVPAQADRGVSLNIIKGLETGVWANAQDSSNIDFPSTKEPN